MLLWLLAALSAHAEPLLSLTPERPSWTSGEQVLARVEGNPSEAVVIPACGSLRAEVFDPDSRGWTPLESERCPKSQAAVPLAEALKGGPVMSIRVVTERFSVVRLVLVYGVSCQPGLPLELATCKRIEAAVSPNLSVFTGTDD